MRQRIIIYSTHYNNLPSIQQVSFNRLISYLPKLIHYQLVFLSILLTTLTSFSQQYSYTHYSTKDGLAGSTVHGIAQDHDGFLWFATETGLSRFDGTHFQNYTRADGLPSNEIFGVFVDSKNRVWFTSFQNAICYYWKGKIYNQQNDRLLKKLNFTSIVSSLAENLKGEILIGCTSVDEYYLLKADSEIVKLSNTRFDIAYGIPTFKARVVSLPQTIQKLVKYHDAYYPPLKKTKFTSTNRAYLFWKNRSYSALYFPVNNQPGYSFWLSPETRHIEYLDDSTLAIIGHNSGGVKLFNLNKRQYIASYLPEYTVHTVFKDIEGCLWFSTKEAGVFRLTNPTFKNLAFYDKKHQLSVISIQKMHDGIYVGSDHSRYWKLQPTQADMRLNNWYYPVKVNADIGFLTKKLNGQLINYSSSNFFRFAIRNPQSLKTLFTFNDTLLISSSLDASLFHIPSGRKIRQLHYGRTTTAYKHENTYYIGTLNGLYTITEQGKKVYLGDENPLFKSRISTFAKDDRGVLWIATYDAGVIGYKNGKIIANITQRKGNLSSDICRCIFISGDMLWVGTEKGLNKIDLSTGRYTTTEKFTANDGLGSDIINTIYAEGDMIYVGTPSGLTYFDQNKVPKHSICYIRLTGVSVSGRPQNPEENHLALENADNNIRFEFSGISFLSSGDITYKYRLLGLDNEWRTVKERILNYPLLPSGKYTLQLQAINKFNEPSDVLNYSFEIKKSLQEKPWFIASLYIIASIIIWIALQWRIRQIRKKEKAKRTINQKIASLEQMALRAQMNPHFIFNCLNSIQHYIIKQDVKGANFYLTQFADLVRKTLENSSKINVPLSEEISYLSHYLELERLQLANRFEYFIDAEIDNKDQIMIPNMVIQPYIENAVKHGVSQLKEGGLIKLTFSYDSNQNVLECIVEDNGAGITYMREKQRQEKNTHLSKGMSITSSRIEILNQLYPGDEFISVQVSDVHESVSESGTRITLRFPLNNLVNS